MNRDCNFFAGLLAEYASGSLPPEARRTVEVHLAGCAACRAELAREEELRAVLGSLPLVSCPPAVSRLKSRPTRWSRFSRWYLGGGLAAAVLMAGLFVPGIRHSSSPPQSPAYTAAEVDQARHDVLATIALTAEVLESSRLQTVHNIFSRRLPQAVAGSLTPLDHQSPPTPNATGGNG